MPFSFKPLADVTLPDIGHIDSGGLTLIVGPNSSGKSQLLRDLDARLSGQPRNLVVAKRITLGKPSANYEEFADWMLEQGFFRKLKDENGTVHLRPTTTYRGTGQPIAQVPESQIQSWHSSYISNFDPEVGARPNEFLNFFGRLFVTSLFLNRRLDALPTTNLIDFLGMPPQHDLHALYVDENATEKLFEEMRQAFGRAVWPDISRGTTICLRVSEDGALPQASDRLSPKKMNEFRSIESEGDGLRSYATICIALLLGRRPVCLIDEPEMCLHPPQAYALGRFIGGHGTSANTATFVATHSSHVLRGVVQATREVKIVRLTRANGVFSAHLVSADVLKGALAKPTLRAETVLDGIFFESVIVVEGDGDRLVYSSVLERLAPQPRLDAHFAAVGGVGGVADTCNLYRKLDIPVAAIVDLDVISDPDRLKLILQSMTDNTSAQALTERARRIVGEVKKLPPTVSSKNAKQRLVALSDQVVDWENGSDVSLRRELNRLSSELDRMRRLKSASQLPSPVKVELDSLLVELATKGLFVVPVGQLEDWFEEAKISASTKWAWANEAASYAQTATPQSGEIWEFLRRIVKFFIR